MEQNEKTTISQALKKSLPLIAFALTMGFTVTLTFLGDSKTPWLMEVLSYSKTVYYICLLAALSVSTALFAKAFKRLSCYLEGHSHKEQVIVCVSLLAVCGAVLALSLVLLSCTSRSIETAVGMLIALLICSSFMLALLVVLALLAVPVRILVGKWKSKNEKSFKITFTAIGAALIALFAVLTYAFCMLTDMKADAWIRPCECEHRHVPPQDVQYYAVIAFACLLIFLLSAAAVISLYKKQARLKFAKSCLAFLLTLGISVTGVIAFFEYSGSSYFDSPYEFAESALGIVKMGLTGDEVTLVSTHGGSEYYVAISEQAAEEFLEKHAMLSLVHICVIPFLGVTRFVIPK